VLKERKTMSRSATIQAVAVALLGGLVLHAANVTAGNGAVIDWRTVKSGEALQEGADAFDTALFFVSLVGEEAAAASLPAVVEVQEPAPAKVSPSITAYMQQPCGGRLRAFEVGRFRVMVEAHSDDAAQAAFVKRLAELATDLA
jgi:hypothetical protein